MIEAEAEIEAEGTDLEVEVQKNIVQVVDVIVVGVIAQVEIKPINAMLIYYFKLITLRSIFIK